MDNYVTLLGAEDVQKAGHTISSAANQMQQAANSIAETFDRQQQQMEEWICRFEVAVNKLIEGKYSSRQEYKLQDIQVESISLVNDCPYCGTSDWDKVGKHPHTGEDCFHPTKIGGPLNKEKK